MTGTDWLATARGFAPGIAAARERFDEDRRLPDDLVAAMHAAGLFHLWLPRALGGPEVPPAEALAVWEELARHDGSVGWCTTIAAGYSRLSGALDEDTARHVFRGRPGILVGSLNPSGKAIPVTGGFRVTGRWTYGSFIDHADWILGNCVVPDSVGADGGPDFRLCIVPRASVAVIDLWNTTGLRGTGSNDYRVEDLFVPDAFMILFPGFNPAPRQPGSLYATPLPSTFVCGIAANMLGIARAALDDLIHLASTKVTAGAGPALRDRVPAQMDLARAEALMRSARAWLYQEVEALWDDVRSGQPVTMERRALVRLAAVTAGQNAMEAVNLAHQLAGGAAIFRGGRLERCFRDIHVAGQHVVMSPQIYMEALGRVLFGLPPGMARF